MRPWTMTECAAVHKELIDAYTLNPPHLGSAPLDHDQCAAVHKELIDAAPSGLLGGASSSTAASDWKCQCALQFPHSTYFGGIHVLQYEHYELDNMTEAFGKLAF